jgi:hypothetical protein
MTIKRTIAFARIVETIRSELTRAIRKYPVPYNSPAEGLAVIQKQFEQLKAAVYGKAYNHAAARREAVSVASTAIRFLYDLDAKFGHGQQPEEKPSKEAVDRLLSDIFAGPAPVTPKTHAKWAIEVPTELCAGCGQTHAIVHIDGIPFEIFPGDTITIVGE